MTTTPMSPIQVRSVKCQQSDVIAFPIIGAEASGMNVVDAGTYLHRDDVVAVIEGYALQFDQAPTVEHDAVAEALRLMAQHIKMRGV